MKLFFPIFVIVSVAFACTNFLVTPEASEEGSIIGYAVDGSELYGALYHVDGGNHTAGETIDIIDWETGRPLGKIPQVETTYNTLGNTNEYGLVIAETTFTGIDVGEQPGAIMDYGSLIYITLQRAKTAKEAIKIMDNLTAEYGYFSTGESFSIADKNEVWVMEMIGKGNYTQKSGEPEKGAVWVACRVPAGHVTAHANQARIRTFPHNDPEKCIFSDDLMRFVREHDLYNGTDEDFSFADVFNPMSHMGARVCELRVWSFFRQVVGAEVMDEFIDFVSGKDYSKRMEWSYKPSSNLTVRRIMELLKDHYEGTPFDTTGTLTKDIGAGAFNMPYRWHPLYYEVDGKKYAHERPISTQQTAIVFVAQIPPNADHAHGLAIKNWFGVDDAACTVFAPMYGSNTEVPDCLAETGHGSIIEANLDSSFWVFNLVANLAYTRWRIIYPQVKERADEIQELYVNKSIEAEKVAMTLSQDEAVKYLSNFSKNAAQEIHDLWKEFWLYLVPRYIDGYVKTEHPGQQNPDFISWGYGDAWLQRIIDETGDEYLYLDESSSASPLEPSTSGSASGSASGSNWPAWKTAVIVVSGVVAAGVIIAVVVFLVRKNQSTRAGYTKIDS